MHNYKMCPSSILPHNMKQKYLMCKLSECDYEVEEPECLCEKCTAEIHADQCAGTGKHKLKANDFEVCTNVKKRSFYLEHKEIVDSIKKKSKH